MQPYPYSLDFSSIDFRKTPERYVVGRGEQGVLSVEPYKSEILPHWRFKNPEIAEKSAKKIYSLFLKYKKAKDFVGMDMSRKFLQMGYTRSRRYANHASGRKYSDVDLAKPKAIGDIPDYKTDSNKHHYVVTKTKKILPQAADWATNEKAQSARIFYGYYEKAKNNTTYQTMKKTWQN